MADSTRGAETWFVVAVAANAARGRAVPTPSFDSLDEFDLARCTIGRRVYALASRGRPSVGRRCRLAYGGGVSGANSDFDCGLRFDLAGGVGLGCGCGCGCGFGFGFGSGFGLDCKFGSGVGGAVDDCCSDSGFGFSGFGSVFGGTFGLNFVGSGFVGFGFGGSGFGFGFGFGSGFGGTFGSDFVGPGSGGAGFGFGGDSSFASVAALVSLDTVTNVDAPHRSSARGWNGGVRSLVQTQAGELGGERLGVRHTHGLMPLSEKLRLRRREGLDGRVVEQRGGPVGVPRDREAVAGVHRRPIVVASSDEGELGRSAVDDEAQRARAVNMLHELCRLPGCSVNDDAVDKEEDNVAGALDGQPRGRTVFGGVAAPVAGVFLGE